MCLHYGQTLVKEFCARMAQNSMCAGAAWQEALMAEKAS